MTRRACLSSKSNTVRREIANKMGVQECVVFGAKNRNISESVCSFHSGPIFFPSLGQKLSRDTFTLSIAFPGAELDRGEGSAHAPEMVEIFEKVTSASVKSNFGGPAGGEALERASPPIGYHI